MAREDGSRPRRRHAGPPRGPQARDRGRRRRRRRGGDAVGHAHDSRQGRGPGHRRLRLEPRHGPLVRAPGGHRDDGAARGRGRPHPHGDPGRRHDRGDPVRGESDPARLPHPRRGARRPARLARARVPGSPHDRGQPAGEALRRRVVLPVRRQRAVSLRPAPQRLSEPAGLDAVRPEPARQVLPRRRRAGRAAARGHDGRRGRHRRARGEDRRRPRHAGGHRRALQRGLPHGRGRVRPRLVAVGGAQLGRQAPAAEPGPRARSTRGRTTRSR